MPSHSTRRQYHEMQARSRTLHANSLRLIADHYDMEAKIARVDWHADAARREAEAVRYEGLAADYRRYALTYDELAISATAQAESAKNDEIQQDYYSGPPGSFTGD